MQQVESIPPTGTALFISNRDRVTSFESPYDFFLPPFQQSQLNTQSYTVLVKQVLLKNHFYNVIATKCDTLSITVNNVDYINIFEAGFYSATSLQSSIQSFLTTINANLLINYDSGEQTFSFTIPNGMTFKINGTQSFSLSPFQYENTITRFSELLGFHEQLNTTITGPTVYVASNPVNLYGTSFIDVNFNTSLNSMHTSQQVIARTLVRVPITTSYGQLEVFEPTVPITGTLESSALDNLRITITNEWGDIVVGPQNSLFSMSLLLVSNDY